MDNDRAERLFASIRWSTDDCVRKERIHAAEYLRTASDDRMLLSSVHATPFGHDIPEYRLALKRLRALFSSFAGEHSLQPFRARIHCPDRQLRDWDVQVVI